MLSSERVNELVAVYDNLKKRILSIDDKYSLDYHEPQLDLPDSLGLEKLVFKPKTDSEISLMAREKTIPDYNTKYTAITVWRDNYRKDIASKRAKLVEKQRVGEKGIRDNYKKASAAMYAKIARNGLLFSTIREKKMEEMQTDCDNKIAELQAEINAETDIINKEEKAYDTLYTNRITDLNIYRQSKESAYATQIRESQRKEQERIEKYNQQVDEKETRYKLTLERFKETARKNEYDRVYKMTKLYAELGETGIKNRRLAEKLEVSKQYFLPLTKEEAQFILSLDNFLRTHLDTNYSAFTTWVNNTLK